MKHHHHKERDNAAYEATLYALFNIFSGVGIVFANKSVFAFYNYKYTCALTWFHTLATIIGCWLMLKLKMFTRKRVPPFDLIPLAFAYVGYIVFGNWNLNINSVGFYQVCKIAVAPTVLIIETVFYGMETTTSIKLSVALVCLGVGTDTNHTSATVTDIEATPFGMFIGLLSILLTGLYQIWAGVEQRKRGLGSMQLLNEFSPVSLVLLTLLTPMLEPMGSPWREGSGILGYNYTAAASIAIAFSSLLGILVSLSTFLVIGATSSLTYNIVGHIKTVLILAGGCIFFGDTMSLKKFLGICVAFGGIVWYSDIKLKQARKQMKTKTSQGKLDVRDLGTLVRRF